MELSLDPGVIVALAAAEGLYLRAVAILRARGLAVRGWQQAAWHGGIALEAVALLGPLDPLAEDLLSAHMAQHLLLADLAVPLLLAGVRSPVLFFLLPRPALVVLARRRRLRAVLRTLRHPLVALPLYATLLYGWHLAFAFEAASRHPLVHALQHESFLLAAVAVWWPALEPQHRSVGGELWKIPYVFGARMLSMFLGSALLFMRTPAYAGFYGDRSRQHGQTPLSDQQLAGGIMMTVDIAIILAALCFFFWLAAVEDARSQAREAAELSRGGGEMPDPAPEAAAAAAPLPADRAAT
jgi:putative membrane protein